LWQGVAVLPKGTRLPEDGSPLRWHFLGVAGISLALGAGLFLFPSLGTFLWPYAIKPLAVRFFAAVFLAVAVASLLALRHAEDRRPLDVLLVMGVSVFGLIALAALADPAALRASAGAVLWFALLAANALGSLLFLVRRPAATEPDPGPPMPRYLRVHFLLHTVVVLLFSLQFLFAPRLAAENSWPWLVSDPVMRGIGGLFTGVAIGMAWASRQRTWGRVRLLLPVNVTFVTGALIAVGLHWSVIAAESPGLHVTVLWLLLYIYTGAYPAYYLLRPPREGEELRSMRAGPAPKN